MILVGLLLAALLGGGNATPYLYPQIYFPNSFTLEERYNYEMMINNISLAYYQMVKDKTHMFDRPWTVTVVDKTISCNLGAQDSHMGLGMEQNGTSITICLPHGKPDVFMVQENGAVFAHEMAHLLIQEQTGDYRVANNLVHYAANLVQSNRDWSYITMADRHYMDIGAGNTMIVRVQIWDINKLMVDKDSILKTCYFTQGSNPYF